MVISRTNKGPTEIVDRASGHVNEMLKKFEQDVKVKQFSPRTPINDRTPSSHGYGRIKEKRLQRSTPITSIVKPTIRLTKLPPSVPSSFSSSSDSTSSTSIPSSPQPPSKPPRTFEHDLYLNAKNKLRPTLLASRLSPLPPPAPTPIPISTVSTPRNSSLFSDDSHIYHSIEFRTSSPINGQPGSAGSSRGSTLRRRSKSFEHIYAEPESPIRDDIDLNEKYKKLRGRIASTDVDPYMVTDLFKVKETPTKPSRIKDIIKQSFSALRRFTRLGSVDRPSQGDDDDAISDISPSEIQERIIYVKTLKRNQALDASSDYYSSVADTKTEVSLCRCCLIIKDDGSTQIIPRNVKLNNTKLIEELTDFKGLDYDYYWFTIWTKDDKFLYAYCERQNRYKRRVCIVSDVYFPELYIRLFKDLGTKEEIDQPVISFLKKKCCALPGDDLNYSLLNLQVPYDCQISITKQSDLLYLISPELLISALATLIHERRVVLVSRQEERLLASCRQLVSLLYPLSWDYMFWPLVPSNHLALVSAINMPFLIGVQSRDVWKFINNLKKRSDKLLIIDLDRNLCLMEIGDESKIIPSKVSKAVQLALDLCLSMNDPHDKYRDGVIREAFIEMFLELIGISRLFVSEDSFSRDQFIASAKSKSHQSFLQWFTETRLFHNYIKFNQLRLIQSRIHPKYNHFLQMGLFEMKSLQIINEVQNSKTTKSLFAKFKI